MYLDVQHYMQNGKGGNKNNIFNIDKFLQANDGMIPVDDWDWLIQIIYSSYPISR